MKVIIAGSRSITDIKHVYRAIFLSEFDITEVVSGHCKIGVDSLGEEWADNHKVPIKLFPADWESFGKSAGMKRNSQMADYADALIAVWDGKSPGTQDMISKAIRSKNISKVYVYKIPKADINTIKLDLLLDS